MNQQDHKPILDNSFSAFIMGLTVGIAGVLLLGTEEGRKLSQKMIDSIPENLNPRNFLNNQQSKQSPPQVIPGPDNPPDHQFQDEPPPPPIRKYQPPSDNFFTQSDQDLN